MLCAYVGDVQGAMYTHPAMPWIITADRYTDMRYRTKMSARNHFVALAESQNNVVNTANLSRALDDGIEHRPHVRRRAADDAEHFGSRRLVLQRLGELMPAILQLFGRLGEQPAQLRQSLCIFNRGVFRRISGRFCSVALRAFFARHNIQPEFGLGRN